MVEQAKRLDAIFGSLSDPTRRDILRRVSTQSLSVGQIARHYTLSFAGVAKHVDVLAQAGLVHKRRQGKEQLVAATPEALIGASAYLESYQRLWEKRLDSLDSYLQKAKKK